MTEQDYRTAFPDFGEMDVAIPPDFKDVSWRNDACPTFHSEEARAFLYIDYADPNLKEHPEARRFVLKAANVDGTLAEADDSDPLLAETDFFGVMLAIIDARRAEFAARPTP